MRAAAHDSENSPASQSRYHQQNAIRAYRRLGQRRLFDHFHRSGFLASSDYRLQYPLRRESILVLISDTHGSGAKAMLDPHMLPDLLRR